MANESIPVTASRRARFPWIVPLALLAIASAFSDARADLAPGLHTGLSVTHQGIPRFYDVLVPASYDGSVAVPLVIDMHGYDRTAAIQRSFSGFAALAEAEGFLVAWPEGFPGFDPFNPVQTWNAGSTCQNLPGIDDVGFIRAMVAAIGAVNRVDPARIYASGNSCGGAMTHRLACEAADLFAAAAPFSWPLPIVACAPSRAMPILMTHSRDDTYILYDGGHILSDPFKPILPGAVFGFEEWRVRDGCTGSSPDVTENPGATSVCELYTSCSGGAKVGLCSVRTDPAIAFGHRPYQSYVLDGFNTQQRAWDFLSSFTLPATPVPALSFRGEVLLVGLLAVAIALRYRRVLSGGNARG